MLNGDMGRKLKLERLVNAARDRRMTQGNFGKMIHSSEFSSCRKQMSEETPGKP